MSISSESLTTLSIWRDSYLADDGVSKFEKFFCVLATEFSLAVIALAASIETIAAVILVSISAQAKNRRAFQWSVDSAKTVCNSVVAMVKNIFILNLSSPLVDD